MKRTIFCILGLLISCVAYAQEKVTATQISDFQAIKLQGGMNVELIPAEENSLEVELWNTNAERFDWKVTKDGVLHMTLKPTVGAAARADVRIYYNGLLHEISVGESMVTAQQAVETHILKIVASGSASVNLPIDAMDTELEVRSNSAVFLSGTSKYLDVSALERSKVDLRELISVAATVDAATKAEVFVHVTERLVARTRSGGTAYHIGAPSILKNTTYKASFGGGVFSIGEPTNR